MPVTWRDRQVCYLHRMNSSVITANQSHVLWFRDMSGKLISESFFRWPGCVFSLCAAVNIPVISSWLLTMIQQCCEFPHPNSLIMKQSLEFPPAQGQKTHSIPLHSPTYPPGRPGGRPPGQADDMCIKSLGLWLQALRVHNVQKWSILSARPALSYSFETAIN